MGTEQRSIHGHDGVGGTCRTSGWDAGGGRSRELVVVWLGRRSTGSSRVWALLQHLIKIAWHPSPYNCSKMAHFSPREPRAIPYSQRNSFPCQSMAKIETLIYFLCH